MKKLLSVSLLFVLFTLNSIAASVSLAWNPSCDPATAGYKVYYGVGDILSTNIVESYTDECNIVQPIQTNIYHRPYGYTNTIVGTNNTITISNLNGGVTYYFAVTKYDASGLESEFSNEIGYTPPSGPPVNFRITSLVTNNTFVTIKFDWNSSTNSMVKIYALQGTNGVLSLTNANVFLLATYPNTFTATVSTLPNGVWRFKALSYYPASGISSTLTVEEPTTTILVRPSTPSGFKITNTGP